MTRPMRVTALAVLLTGGATLVAAPAHAQRAQVTSPHGDDEIVINGRRAPMEQDKAYLQCVRLATDTSYRAMRTALAQKKMTAPAQFAPTRLPRDPDFTRPPTVPVGSPITQVKLDPRFTRSRMDMYNLRADASRIAPGVDQATIRSEFSQPESFSYEREQASCVEQYKSNFAGEPYQLADGTWMATGDDATAATAILLFDQGRYAEALPLFLKASEQASMVTSNGAGVAVFIAKIYLQGLGAKSDPLQAIRWLKTAANAAFNPVTDTPLYDPDQPELNTNIGEAAVMLGNIYALGLHGIEKRPVEALRWYQRAYEVGHITAAKMIGDMYLHGYGAPRDAVKARIWYEKAARFGLAAAQVAMADLLNTGADKVAQDRKRALKWYQSAAERDNADALFALARAYDFGDGVKADPEMALGLYKTAAMNGSAPAKTALGIYFHEGRLVAQSEATARDWFERAAAERDAEGMFNLAAMMANGQGGERDLASAYLWLSEAKTRGHEKAPVALAALERRMTPAERQAAQSATVK